MRRRARPSAAVTSAAAVPAGSGGVRVRVGSGDEVTFTPPTIGLSVKADGLLVHGDQGLHDLGASAMLCWTTQGADSGRAGSVAPR